MRFFSRNSFRSTSLDTLACSDIDECALSSTICSEDQICSNTVGSYECLSSRTTTTGGVEGKIICNLKRSLIFVKIEFC